MVLHSVAARISPGSIPGLRFHVIENHIVGLKPKYLISNPSDFVVGSNRNNNPCEVASRSPLFYSPVNFHLIHLCFPRFCSIRLMQITDGKKIKIYLKKLNLNLIKVTRNRTFLKNFFRLC